MIDASLTVIFRNGSGCVIEHQGVIDP